MEGLELLVDCLVLLSEVNHIFQMVTLHILNEFADLLLFHVLRNLSASLEMFAVAVNYVLAPESTHNGLVPLVPLKQLVNRALLVIKVFDHCFINHFSN